MSDNNARRLVQLDEFRLAMQNAAYAYCMPTEESLESLFQDYRVACIAYSRACHNALADGVIDELPSDCYYPAGP